MVTSQTSNEIRNNVYKVVKLTCSLTVHPKVQESV